MPSRKATPSSNWKIQEDLQAAVARAEAELLDAQQALNDLNTSLESGARHCPAEDLLQRRHHPAELHPPGRHVHLHHPGPARRSLKWCSRCRARLDKARAAYQPYRDYDTAVDPYSGYFPPVSLSTGEGKVVSKLPLTSASAAMMIAVQSKFVSVVLPSAPGETVRIKPIPAMRSISKENLNKIYPDKVKSRADTKNQSYNYMSDEEKIKYDLKKAYDQALKDYNLAVTRLSLNASLDTAESALSTALKDYQDMQAGPDPQALAKAKERLSAATKPPLAAAQADLRKTALVSPITGKVVKVGRGRRRAGVQAFQTIVTVADFSRWYIETNNLTEIDVVDIHQGQRVTVTADALPDLKMQGVVEQINQVFEEKSGDVTYTTRILLDQVDPLIRWGMTTLVVAQK